MSLTVRGVGDIGTWCVGIALGGYVANKGTALCLVERRLSRPQSHHLSLTLHFNFQSDPDLVTSSGEMNLGTKSGLALNRGQIPLISYIGGLSCH
eukprot:sb/3479266/